MRPDEPIDASSAHEPRATRRPVAPPGRAGASAYPLSSAQRRIWFLQQLVPSSTAFNVPLVFRIEGTLDVDALRRSLDAVIRRHSLLRTTFHLARDGDALQQPEPWMPVTLPVRYRDDGDEREWRAELLRASHAQSCEPIDLTGGPPYRCELLTAGNRRHALVMTVHHIVMDGWSVGVLLRDLSESYRALAAGRASRLLPTLPQFADFVRWEATQLQGRLLASRLDHWRRRMAGAPATLDLPIDRPRPPLQSFRGTTYPLAYSDPLLRNLKALSRRHGATMFMTLAAAFCAWLSRVSDQRDIVIGTVVANRERKEDWDLVGMFANTIPMRADLAGDPTFNELLDRVRTRALEDFAHADLPTDRLVQELKPPRDPSRSPLFQVGFVFQNSPWPHVPAGGDASAVTVVTGDNGAATFDLTLQLQECPDGLSGSLEYATDLFEPTTIRCMAEQLDALLHGIAAAPHRRLSRLPLTTPGEEHRVITRVSVGEGGGHAPRCIHDRIADRARAQPNAPAIVARDGELTYRELDRGANRLARRLRSLGVRPETRVGVCLPRESVLVRALLGVLKAGACYVPLDPAYPPARLQWMMKDAGVEVVLTHAPLRAALSPARGRVLLLDDESCAAGPYAAKPLDSLATPQNLAYVLYTSGSTGRPKGVTIEHRSASALVDWAAGVFSDDELRGVLAATSVSWDLSVFELWVTLSLGGTVILGDTLLDSLPEAHRTRVRLVNTVPSVAAAALRAGTLPPSPRTVNLAGEPVSDGVVNALYARGSTRVLNLYGPTEDTTYSTVCPLRVGVRPAIGRPLPGTQAYVLGENMEPVPLTLRGELFLGGEGLARGYLGRPDMTAERFVPNPFGPPGTRLYRTGDVARYSSSEQLEFMGRRDEQVKVRGFRVELAEVEAALGTHPGLTESAVVGEEDPGGGTRLAAYVVTSPGAVLSAGGLRAHLRGVLPEYMIPSVWVFLDALPRTPTQKIDRRALPSSGATTASSAEAHVPPRDQVESTLSEIWKEVLHVPRAGVHDNFFTSGGHSLLAARVLTRIRDAFGVELPVPTLFEGPTVAQLAERVRLATWALAPLEGGTEAEHIEL